MSYAHIGKFASLPGISSGTTAFNKIVVTKSSPHTGTKPINQ